MKWKAIRIHDTSIKYQNCDTIHDVQSVCYAVVFPEGCSVLYFLSFRRRFSSSFHVMCDGILASPSVTVILIYRKLCVISLFPCVIRLVHIQMILFMSQFHAVSQLYLKFLEQVLSIFALSLSGSVMK